MAFDRSLDTVFQVYIPTLEYVLLNISYSKYVDLLPHIPTYILTIFKLELSQDACSGLLSSSI